jgi:hypothetical protein
LIVAITTCLLPTPLQQEEALAAFLDSTPEYQAVAGLVRKYYYLSQDGRTMGGVYLCNSRVEAEAMFDESWRSSTWDRYRTNPSVAYFDCPVIVDNLSNEVLTND